MNARIGWLKLGLVVAVVIIGARLFQIQIIQHDEFVQAASSEHMRKFELLAERGQIYMMDGEEVVPVVMNERVWTVFVDPAYVSNETKVRETLDEILGDKIFADWTRVFEDKQVQYYEVAHGVIWDEISAVDAANLKGVGKKESTRRVYPNGELASQVLGFINAEGVGYGAEGSLNALLMGKNGSLKTVADVNDVPLTLGDKNVKVPAEDGKDVALSIDITVQRAVEKILAQRMEEFGANYMSAVVMDPYSGRIYAMANLPAYNPETYWKVSDAGLYRNKVLEDPYEAASVIKTFVFAGGIENGAIRPNDRYDNKGTTVVDDWTIKNAYAGMIGTITFQDALGFSLNTGSIEVLRRYDASGRLTKEGREKLYDVYFNKFGLGKKTGIEFYEAAGTVLGPNEGYGRNVRYANMTFGQGMDVTMMQVATAFSATINGGNFVVPRLVAGEVINETLVEEEQEAKISHRAVSAETSATMRDMLVKARAVSYTSRVDLPGYAVGGKSGTAETYDASGAYTKSTTIASYIGFGGQTKDLPEYVVMVRIGGDGANFQGSVHAAPVFTDISNYMIKHLRIMPEG